MQALLNEILDQVRPLIAQGKVATYIPALADVAVDQLGIAVYGNDGELFTAGDAHTPFSIQSISKVFSLVQAIQHSGESIWERLGHEPSGQPFNSLVQLELENGRPRNPFINAGALVISDINQSRFAAPALSMRDFVRRLSGNPHVVIDRHIAESEYQHRARNAAMAYLMQSFGNFHNDVEMVLRNYFSYCALSMSCVDLVKAFCFLARDGFCKHSGEQILSARQTQQVNSIMATSGLYDEAGNFAYRVGLPGKSGVGGGIVAIVPGQYTICVWSPGLNKAGNSLAGMAALEVLSERIGWSVF
ncbi:MULTISPECIES: glutaminase B [Pseudomonadaceae]|uniref:Glutaminase n=1 Tax=Pseudomonas straminea TaxID=47882 RepID=A0A1I1S2Y4_PSEOC|nr:MULTISPECIES: glutaminase B [Pseudomonas]MDD1506185.1 glutaminase B [Pseudomonas sp. CNPSo 3701]TWE06750.1 L-glutaminase [Pseudomonas sp. AG1028]GLX11928.1 glutaminase [Pseudomonas straminea]SFD40737.1 L-glutaminase [Pseudomonas straminea]